MMLLLVYVDDILITEESYADIQQVISYLNTPFSLKTLGSVSYFLGFEAVRDSSGLHLSQFKYVVDLLHKTNMLNAKPLSTPVYQFQTIST